MSDAITDWTTLQVGRLYELRSGDDRQRARYLGSVTDDSGQFELEDTSVSQSYSQSEWDVYPV
jgi:hypothetical protein